MCCLWTDGRLQGPDLTYVNIIDAGGKVHLLLKTLTGTRGELS